MATMIPVSRTPLCYVVSDQGPNDPPELEFGYTECRPYDNGAIAVFPEVEDGFITVPSDPLFQLLSALNGPGHLIRELQALRGPLVGDDNPINILVDRYNDWVNKVNKKETS